MPVQLKVEQFLDEAFLRSNTANFNYLADVLKTSVDNIAYILGAGMSYDIGLPLWKDLIEALLVKGVAGRDSASPSMNKLMNEFNVLEVAEYLQTFMEKIATGNIPYITRLNVIPLEDHQKIIGLADRYIAQAVKTALIYCKAREDIRSTRSAEEKWASLTNLAKFFDGRVKQVITYNYDDALESVAPEADSRGITQCVYTLKPCNQKAATIYHVHGRLPIFTDCGPDDDTIILTEDSYQNLERSIYNNTNLCQANAFSQNICLFMGFSRQDPNFRRISAFRKHLPEVEIAYRKRVLDELSTGRLEFSYLESEGINGVLPHFVLCPINLKDLPGDEKHAVNMFLEMQAHYLLRHWIFPIFVTFSDIPILLDDLEKQSRRVS